VSKIIKTLRSGGFLGKEPKEGSLHRASAALAHHASLLVVDEEPQRREAYEDIDDPFHHRPCSEDHVNDVPIAAHESAETDQAPVKASHNEEDEAEYMQILHKNMNYIKPDLINNYLYIEHLKQLS